jgi:hypothetical protein
MMPHKPFPPLAIFHVSLSPWINVPLDVGLTGDARLRYLKLSLLVGVRDILNRQGIWVYTLKVVFGIWSRTILKDTFLRQKRKG